METPPENLQSGSDRQEKNSLAFLDHIAGMGGYKLRPVSYLTVEQLSLLDLAIAKGKAVWSKLVPDEMLDELHAYLFIQAGELAAVSRAVRSYRRALGAGQEASAARESFIIEHVEPFLASLTPEIKAELADQLGSFDEVAAARIQAAPPPDDKRERPDPK